MALPSQAFDMQAVVHEIEHLLDLFIETFEVWYDSQLWVRTEHIQASLVALLRMFDVLKTNCVAGTMPLGGLREGTRHHVHHQIVTLQKIIIREFFFAGHSQSLLPLFVGRKHLTVKRATIQQDHCTFPRMKSSKGFERIFLVDLVIEEDTLHANLLNLADPLILQSIGVGEEVCGVLGHREHLEAARTEASPENCNS
jgi:hypothetical protein